MTKMKYTVTLLSDAEPGTGMGGELVQQRIPRDADGRPVIPASHIKGLVREELLILSGCDDASALGDDLVGRCLGRPDGKEMSDGERNEANCRFTDAKLIGEITHNAEYVTRTALDPDRGRAKDGSLRTSERIAVGTVFHGTVDFDDDGNSQESLAIRAALLAVRGIGSSRSRGVGRVLVQIEKETRKPGELIQAMRNASPRSRAVPSGKPVPEPGEKLKTLRLLFTAEGPICLPERPIGVGPVESGFAVSAGAVRGWIISRLAAEQGEEFASALYESDRFRAWPLLPCGYAGQDNYPVPTRVSLTHKIAKLTTDGDKLDPETNVEDKPIQEMDWEKLPSNSPLKASDGVLLTVTETASVEIWKARSMPKIMTAHGVHNDPQTVDGRNLYQVEAMAPLVWSGVVVLPENWADILTQSVKENPTASFGRFRSTRGFGQLKIEECNEAVPLPWSETKYANILILQSPIRLPDTPSDPSQTANQEFETMIQKGWKDFFDRLGPSWSVRAVSTNIGIQFGWNRSGKGEMTGKGRRLSARRVVLPGSIFEIYPKAKESDEKVNLSEEEKRTLYAAGLSERIQRGLGEGVERGFGAVSVHPGMAEKVYQKTAAKSVAKNSDKAEMARAIFHLWLSHKENLPSSSQISTVAGMAAKDRKTACDYLQHQMLRGNKIWATWRPIIEKVNHFLQDDHCPDRVLQFGLKLLTDLVKYQEKMKKNKIKTDTLKGGLS